MSPINISLPANLKFLVDEQLSQRGYGSSSGYVRELARNDVDDAIGHELRLPGLRSWRVPHGQRGIPVWGRERQR